MGKLTHINVSNTDNRSRNVWGIGELQAVERIGKTGEDNNGGTEEYEQRKRRPVKSMLGRMVNGISDWVDGYWDIEPDIPRVEKGIAKRKERLQCLGNAVVPQQFYPIFRAIAECEGNRVY